jgi:hypothetical protein
VRRPAAAFTAENVPPSGYLGYSSLLRKSGSKLPHSKAAAALPTDREAARAEGSNSRAARRSAILLELQQVLLQGGVRPPRVGKVARLQRRAQLIEQLADRARGARVAPAAASAAKMVVMVPLGGLALRGLILEVLLDGRVVLLGSLKVARLEVTGKLVERSGDGNVALR